MKHIFITALGLIFINQLVNAQDKSSNDRDKTSHTIIAGKFPEPIETISLRIKDYSRYNEFLENRKAKYVIDTTINKINGEFHYEFETNHPVYVELNHNFLPFGASKSTGGVLIESGDSIYVDFTKGRQLSDVRFSGRGFEKMSCIQQIVQNCKKFAGPFPNNQSRSMSKLLGLEYKPDRPLSYKLSSMDSITHEIRITVSKFKLSRTAKSMILADYITVLAGSITDHILDSEVNIHSPEAKRIFISRAFPSNKYVDGIKIKNPLPDASDHDLIYTRMFYMDLLKNGLMRFAMETNTSYPNSVDFHAFHAERLRVFKREQYDALSKFIPNAPIKEMALSNFIYNGIKMFGFNPETKAVAEKFIAQTSPKSSFHLGIKSLYDRYENRLKEGANAYPFALPDTSGKIVKLSHFKGKVVILDFMFTGCGGCATMVPFLAKVEHKFSDNPNVVFIAVSVSKDVNDVKKGYGRFCTKGSIPLYTEGMGYNHPICWFYNATYPQLVVIDQSGKIISSNAPRPTFDDGAGLTAIIEKSLQNNN